MTALAVALLLAAPAQGASTLEHLTVRDVELAAGEDVAIPLAFRGLAFEAGWAVVVNVQADGSGSLAVDLVQSNRTIEQWNVTPGEATRHLHGAFAETARARLDLAARDGPVNLSLYYDMSCECAGKQIPVGVPDGRTVFRIQVQDGATWQAAFPEPPAHDLTVHRTTRTDPDSRWPDDFGIEETSDAPPHNFTWTVETTGDAYMWMVSEQIHLDRLDAEDATLVGPTFHPVPASTSEATPLPTWLAVAAPLVAWLLRRRT